MLSAEQRARFEECGLLHLPGLVEARVVAALRDRITALLHARGFPPEPCPPDFAVTPSKTASVVSAYAFEAVWGEATLALVAPRAGGTLVACGTHRLIDALRRREGASFAGHSADIRRLLRAEVPWLRALWSLREGEDRSARFLAPTLHEGVPLRVAELVGEPGDVHVMHPWLLHAPAANCGDAPRLVLTERIRVAERPT